MIQKLYLSVIGLQRPMSISSANRSSERIVNIDGDYIYPAVLTKHIEGGATGGAVMSGQ